MKINILKVAAFFSGMCALASCTTPELENFDEYSLTEPAKSESYYEALRAFKQSKHPISFGWYAGWSEPGVSTASMLAGLPDSMDVVSLWGGWNNLSEGKKRDLKFVQEKKGFSPESLTIVKFPIPHFGHFNLVSMITGILILSPKLS